MYLIKEINCVICGSCQICLCSRGRNRKIQDSKFLKYNEFVIIFFIDDVVIFSKCDFRFFFLHKNTDCMAVSRFKKEKKQTKRPNQNSDPDS